MFIHFSPLGETNTDLFNIKTMLFVLYVMRALFAAHQVSNDIFRQSMRNTSSMRCITMSQSNGPLQGMESKTVSLVISVSVKKSIKKIAPVSEGSDSVWHV